jgi:hypothetical protein
MSELDFSLLVATNSILNSNAECIAKENKVDVFDREKIIDFIGKNDLTFSQIEKIEPAFSGKSKRPNKTPRPECFRDTPISTGSIQRLSEGNFFGLPLQEPALSPSTRSGQACRSRDVRRTEDCYPANPLILKIVVQTIFGTALSMSMQNRSSRFTPYFQMLVFKTHEYLYHLPRTNFITS